MSEPLTAFLTREYEYLRSREGGDFFLALAPYVEALNDRPEIRAILSSLEAEALTALQRFVDEQNDFIEEAKAIRTDLATLAPEIDKLGHERTGSPGSRLHGVGLRQLRQIRRSRRAG